MALVAVTLGATCEVRGPGGPRMIPADEFIQGPYTTALEPADVLVAVALPAHEGASAVVVEHARRHGDFAVVSVAALGERAENGVWQNVRIGLGGVNDRPVLARRAADVVEGTRLEPATVREAGAAALDAADPGSDVRASAEYRKHLVPIYVERALEALRATRPGGGA
jgi:carbon-monoxide dehydrogenase medium subunit